MKKKQMTLLILSLLSAYFNPSYGQKKKAYEGTWQWTSDRKDTLIIVFTTITRPMANKLYRDFTVAGYHKFIKEGKVVADYTSAPDKDSLTGKATFEGTYAPEKNMVGFGFSDPADKEFLGGTFELITSAHGHKLGLLLLVDWHLSPRRPEGFTLTIPNNIIMKKID